MGLESMKTAVFDLNLSSAICMKNLDKQQYQYEIAVPTLSAYAIEYSTLQLSGLTTFLHHSTLMDDKIEVHTKFRLEDKECKLVIHYHGIRDYALLFPSVKEVSLKNRLGEFYRETEFAFNEGIWLSFMLMCGGIFEGLLYSKIGKKLNFNQLIDLAHSSTLINDRAKNIMHNVRNYRNLVHANKHSAPYVSRVDAMDTRAVLDSLIKAQ